jgi:hypothetical protein
LLPAAIAKLPRLRRGGERVCRRQYRDDGEQEAEKEEAHRARIVMGARAGSNTTGQNVALRADR